MMRYFTKKKLIKRRARMRAYLEILQEIVDHMELIYSQELLIVGIEVR
jgi:hypothetical protein